MCGFISIVRDKGLRENDLDLARTISEVIEHRGPDDYGVYNDDNVIMSFRRLSIIDLANGHQPYSYDEGKYKLLFNGEVYNYREIREELIARGYEFTTDSEAEVMLSAYKEYGKDFVKKFRGMYAFIVYDRENRKIYAGRDIFGIKPLYYYDSGDSLVLASEQKSLAYLDDDFSINKEGLQHYLTYQFVPEPQSILKEVQIIPPGCLLEKELGREVNIERYFKIELKPQFTDEQKRLEEIRAVMRDSVKSHMISDVPVGAFLSGGIDSTIVVALAKELMPDIKTFTVGFEVNGYSEVSLAQETAERLGVESIARIVTPQEYMKEFPKIMWHLDGPVADPSAIPIYFISEEARKHVKVVLSGEGADEMFGGYTIYRESESLKMFNYIPNPIKALLKAFAALIPENVRGKSFIERGCTPLEERYFGNANIFKEKEKHLYLPFYNDSIKATDITKPYYDEVHHLDGVCKMQHIDINTWLRGDILVKSDRMTMAHSLELRVPFLDKEVLRVASHLTRYEKIGGKTTKSALRDAFKDIIPQDVQVRRKLGYPVPIRVWLKNEMYDWAKDIINRSEATEFINKAEAIKLLDAHREGKKDYSRNIWTILSFLVWYEEFTKHKSLL